MSPRRPTPPCLGGLRPGCAIALGLLSLAACGTTPVEIDVEFEAEAPTGTPAVFDPIDPEIAWRTGDRVVYEFIEHRGEQERSWTLDLELLELPKEPPVQVLVGNLELAEAEGLRSVQARVLQENAQVRLRFTDSEGEVLVEERSWETLIHTRQTDVLGGLDETLGAQFGNLIGVQALFEELLGVIRRPSLLSVLRSGGVVALHLRYAGEEPPEYSKISIKTTAGDRIDLPVAGVPFWIDANGQPALLCKLWFTWARSPLLLSGGLVAIEGRHPTDPSRSLEVRLVRATRGPEVPGRDPAQWDAGESRSHTVWSGPDPVWPPSKSPPDQTTTLYLGPLDDNADSWSEVELHVKESEE